MRIFLTGGTGFIGSHILNESINYDYQIIALKRESSRTKVDLLTNPNWKVGSLNQPEENYFKNFSDKKIEVGVKSIRATFEIIFLYGMK